MKRLKIVVTGSSDQGFLQLYSSLKEEGFDISQFKSLPEFLTRKGRNLPSLILFNLDNSKLKEHVFKEIKKAYPAVPVIILSSPEPDCIKKSLQLVKIGAYDYLKKPFTMDELKIVIRRALKEKMQNLSGVSMKKDDLDFSSFLPGFIVGKNHQMRQAITLAQKVAPTDFTVLIQGESGTGKEMVASLIHSLSRRRKKDFLKLNCAALTESIMESELFGYERGAFTGADTKKKGLFAAIDGGTILLDEITETSTNTQAKLLRIIENKEFIPVGGTAPVKCDVRIIAATNKDLREEIQRKRFRSDLYFRINTFTIYLPPLRERKEDIPLFIDHFVKKYSTCLKKEIEGLSSEIYEILLNYPWPGNIRELETTVLRMVVTCSKPFITLEEVKDVLPAMSKNRKSPLPFEKAREKFLSCWEEKYIKELLLLSRGNISQAAKRAGVTRAYLYKKINKYQIDLAFYRKKASFVF